MNTYNTHNVLSKNNVAIPLQSLKDLENSLENYHFRSVINHYHTTNTDQIMKILPCNLSNFWGYEVRLVSENASDLLICISEHQKKNLLDQLGHPALQSDEWKIVKNIIQQWNDPKISYNNEILNIWLEFDQKNNTLPNPNFFIGPNPTLNASQLLELFQHTFNKNLQHPLNQNTLNQFLKTCKLIPYESWSPQIGMMLSRNQTNIRSYIHNIHPKKMYDFLENLGWLYCENKFKILFEKLYTFSNLIDLDLDISENVGTTIGLECYFDTTTPQNINNLLDFLVTNGYACEIMSQKLKYYIQNTTNKQYDNYREYLHHIKIIYNPNGACEAKAYLTIRKNNY